MIDVVKGLGDWGQKWVDHDITADDVDPKLLVWNMHRRVNVDLLLPERVVVQLTFYGAYKGDFWLVLERPEPSVCMNNPGFDVDVFVTTDTIAIHKVWMGIESLAECLDDGRIESDGLTAHVDAFLRWLKLSDFAGVKPAGISA